MNSGKSFIWDLLLIAWKQGSPLPYLQHQNVISGCVNSNIMQVLSPIPLLQWSLQ